MSLVEVLRQDAEVMYATTEALMRRVPADGLEWKPTTGKNWMSVAQLLMHCSNSCGMGIKAFLTGDWGLPEGVRFEDMKPEERAKIQENYEAYRRITGEQRRLLEQNYRRFRSLTQEEQRELRKNYRRWQQMKPQQRSRVLENYHRWQKLTPA